MSIQIGELVVDLRGDVARLRTDMADAKRVVSLSAKDIVNQMESMRGALSRMDFMAVWYGIEKGIGYATTALSGLKRTAIDNADQLNKLSQSTGWSTETLSAMRYAAELSDVELEGLTKSLKTLSTNMFEARNGSKEMATVFAKLGIPLDTSEEALLAIADRFAAMPDGAEKAALAVKLFSRDGMAMIPFLNQGRDGIAQLTEEARRMGLVISGETARQAEAFNDNLKRLERNLSGLVQQIGAAAMPTLLGLSEHFLEAKTQAGGLDENLRRLAGNRAAMESFLESTAVGLAHVAEQAVLLKRVLAQPFSSAEAIGVDVRTWLEKDALKSMKAIGFNQQQIDQAIHQLEAGRANYMAQANQTLAGINDNPGYVSGVKQFFDEQRRIVRVEGRKYVYATEEEARQAQAALEKFLISERGTKPGGVSGGYSAEKPKLDLIDPFGKERAAALKVNLAERDRLLRQEFDSEAHTIDEWADRMAGMNKLDQDVAKGLEDVSQSAFGNAYTGRFDAIAKQLEQYVHRFEASKDQMAEVFGKQAPENMLFAINGWADAAYKLAAVEGAGEEIGRAMSERQQRMTTLQAMVTTGIRTETEARREGIDISQQALAAVTPHLDVLQNLAKSGYPPAVRALQAFQAELISLRDLATEKTWMDGIQSGLRDYAGMAVDTFATTRDAVKSAFKSMEDALTEFVMTGKLNFKDMANSIISDLVRIQIQESITKPLAGAMSGFNWGSLFGFAQGGIPGGQGISDLNNRIVDRPTFFKFAAGAGVVGEAGTEGIFPLKRMRNGDFGIQAEGGGGATTIVNVIEAPGRGGQTTRRQEGGKTIVEVMVEQISSAIAGNISSGRGPVPAAMQSTYGLNRAAGAF
jgi:hypothetical protein